MTGGFPLDTRGPLLIQSCYDVIIRITNMKNIISVATILAIVFGVAPFSVHDTEAGSSVVYISNIMEGYVAVIDTENENVVANITFMDISIFQKSEIKPIPLDCMIKNLSHSESHDYDIF